MNIVAKEFYKKSQGNIQISWKNVEEGVSNIVESMKKNNFVPDVIISIARSGLIPAAMVAYAIKNKELYVIKVDFSKTQRAGQDQDLRETPIISQELSRDIQGKKILVVDEMVVSGQTLKLVSDYMKMKAPAEVRYAVLFRQPWSEFDPNYFGRELKQWPVYPWKSLS